MFMNCFVILQLIVIKYSSTVLLVDKICTIARDYYCIVLLKSIFFYVLYSLFLCNLKLIYFYIIIIIIQCLFLLDNDGSLLNLPRK